MNASKSVWKLFYRFNRINSRIHLRNYEKLDALQTLPSLNRRRLCSSNHEEIEEITGIYPYVENQIGYSDVAAHTLFSNSPDQHSQSIAKCVSVEEVFTFVKSHINHLNPKHLAQVVLIIKELKSIYNDHYRQPGEVDTFLGHLLEHPEFVQVTTTIESKLDKFDPVSLSYTLYHLYKLDISVESPLIQGIAIKLRDHLLSDFNLEVASRLVNVVFHEHSVRPYYIVLNLIPTIFDQIDQVKTTKDLDYLTLCLYKLNNILTKEIVTKYQLKVDELVERKILTKKDYKLVIMVGSLCNLPAWRHYSSNLISKCLYLIGDSIEQLNLIEMCHLYEIFFKNQEPGEMLNSIQRAAAKLLHEMDDGDVSQLNRLKLFSSVIYYSSPANKKQFRQDITKYLGKNDTFQSLITLRKIFSYLKISDPKLWETYWNQACQVMKRLNNFEKTLKLIENYLLFCGDLYQYKHPAFEHHVLTLIQKHLDCGTLTLYPGRFFSAYSFALVCSYNQKLLDSLTVRFKEMSTQLTTLDIFRLSHSLQLLQQRKSIATPATLKEVSRILRDQTERLYQYKPDMEYSGIFLLKSAVIRRDYGSELVDDMLIRLKEIRQMSSKFLEFTCYNMQTTKSLIPEVVNLCTSYITANRSRIIGFNAEKMLVLLYELNYRPVYEEEFFKTVIDIIIRDQERMSGLGFLQATLSLCYFNQMPKSFVKKIFNVEFLDKLDVELANCYYKDKYPRRVRDVLMQLNRAVCLEYPEYDVPWFHQKYLDEYQKNFPIDDVVNSFHRSVKWYLYSILGEETLLENVITPYGYEIDFVCHLDKARKPTVKFDDPSTTKFAILLRSDYDFTRLYVRLRGKRALMNRHLEILGYKVKTITVNQWGNLLYSEERAEFIDQVVFS